MLFVLIAI